MLNYISPFAAYFGIFGISILVLGVIYLITKSQIIIKPIYFAAHGGSFIKNIFGNKAKKVTTFSGKQAIIGSATLVVMGLFFLLFAALSLRESYLLYLSLQKPSGVFINYGIMQVPLFSYVFIPAFILYFDWFSLLYLVASLKIKNLKRRITGILFSIFVTLISAILSFGAISNIVCLQKDLASGSASISGTIAAKTNREDKTIRPGRLVQSPVLSVINF